MSSSDSGDPIHMFSGEVQFARFGDSSTNGPTVTFRLQDRDELEAFVGLEGRRLACVLVLMDDQESPVAPPARARGAQKQRPKARNQPHHKPRKPDPPPRQRLPPLCEWAVMACKSPTFLAWLERHADLPVEGRLAMQEAAENGLKPEHIGRAVILTVCEIETRHQLDYDDVAADKFRKLLLRPFKEWQAKHEGVRDESSR